jgi:hypothetical protein
VEDELDLDALEAERQQDAVDVGGVWDGVQAHGASVPQQRPKRDYIS